NGLWAAPQVLLHGYEIHMGETKRGPFHLPAFKIIERLTQKAEIEDGAISSDGRVWGTYIHGLFDNDEFRRRFIEFLKERKGGRSSSKVEEWDYCAFKEREYEKLAAALRKDLDIERIYQIIGISSPPSTTP
ncbi:MAG: cobyric acid synthase CobQ, partial [Deltaproteobacteria bacterium]|nr:cobyric acid synthase CobQ [Deltaproteobacteria bacterium]